MQKKQKKTNLLIILQKKQKKTKLLIILQKKQKKHEKLKKLIKTVGAGYPPKRRNLVKTNWAVNSERQDKEDDVVDNLGGKLEQLDEKEATKEEEPSKNAPKRQKSISYVRRSC